MMSKEKEEEQANARVEVRNSKRSNWGSSSQIPPLPPQPQSPVLKPAKGGADSNQEMGVPGTGRRDLDETEEQIVLRQIESRSHERKRIKSLLASTHSFNLTVNPIRAHLATNRVKNLTKEQRDNDNNEKTLNQQAEDDNQDSSSSATTTSDVNSEDDAASIASRLSQIVVEEEEKLFFPTNRQRWKSCNIGLEQDTKNMTQFSVSEEQGLKPSPVEKPILLTRHNSLHDSSNAQHQKIKSAARFDGTHEQNGSLPEIYVFENFDQPKSAASTKKLQSNDGSIKNVPMPKLSNKSLLASKQRVKVDVANAREIRASKENIIQEHTQCMRRNESCNFLPERGDLRRLGSARRNSAAAIAAASVQQQKIKSSNSANVSYQSDTSSIEQLEGHRLRSNTAESREKCNLLGTDDELILNIRRSAWTLSDFDQTFNKLESGNSKSSEFLADPNGSESISDASNLLISNNEIENSDNIIDASTKNLINSGAKNFAQQQQQQQLENKLQDATLGATPQDATGDAQVADRSDITTPQALLNHSPGEDPYRRPSFAPSFASFISSIDSFSVHQSDRKDSERNVSMQGTSTAMRKRKNLNNNDQIMEAGKRGKHHNFDTSEHTSNDCQCCCGLGRYCNFKKVANCFPILRWLPAYTLTNLLGDLTAGMAVAVLNISTSMSAAVVAGTDFGVAFRASIVNTFVYSILCSSRHTSFGSWSIMSQMLLVSVRRALSDELILARLNMGPTASWEPEEYEKWHLNIIIMYTFLIGVIQLVCGLLNLGNILASFIPQALCSSMITATAFTMAIGQLANMCGTSNRILWSIERNTTVLWADLKNPPVDITDLFSGLFRWIQQIALLIKFNEQINLICVLISVVTVILLYLNQYVIQKQVERLFKRKIFIPSEMILLVLMIIISNLLNLNAEYNVTTCGPIVIEFVIPNLPNLKLVRELWYESVATALISYTMVHVMSKTYSNKFNYEVDSNQELIACGAGNLIGGLFDALPATASFTRTAGQVEAGGQTQMASIINCLLLVILAQLLGPYVAELPICVMAATLFFGFAKMMSRFTDIFMYWRVCKVDFLIWIVTFVAILMLDIVNGFVYGFIFSILTMLYRAQNRRCYLLGSIGTSDVYVPLVKYPLAEEVDGIKIFQFCGPIHYVCAELFERLLRHKTRVDVKRIRQNLTEQEVVKFNPADSSLPTHIILDFSMISYIDSAGIYTIKKIIEDYQRVNITILLASLASHVAAVVKNEPSLWNVYKNRFYVTLADAVHCASRDSRLLANRDQSVKVIVT